MEHVQGRLVDRRERRLHQSLDTPDGLGVAADLDDQGPAPAGDHMATAIADVALVVDSAMG